MIFAALAALLVVSAYGTLPAADSSNADASLSIPVEYEISRGIKADTKIVLTGIGSAPMPEGSEGGTCELRFEKSGRGEFGPIIYSRPDVYEYRVTKETADIDGMTKDESVYIVRVQVTYDGKSVMVIQKDGEEEKYEAVSYADAVIGDVYDDPPVKKIVTGDKAPGDDLFSFSLKAVSAKSADPAADGEEIMRAFEMPMPEGSSKGEKVLTLKAGQEGEFGLIHFIEPGIYSYEISEKDNGLQGYTYDRAVYHVQYTVTVENGKWKSVRKVTDKDGNEVNISTFVFTNGYKRPAGGILRTGDKNNMQIYACIMLTALLALAAMLIRDEYNRRKKKNDIS
jgi:pilin isopeptide linkage protein